MHHRDADGNSSDDHDSGNGGDGRTSYAHKKHRGKRTTEEGPVKKKRKMGGWSHPQERPMMIGPNSPHRRWQMVVSSSLDNEVRMTSLPSLPPMQDVCRPLGVDANLGGGAWLVPTSIGATPATGVTTSVPEQMRVTMASSELVTIVVPESSGTVRGGSGCGRQFRAVSRESQL